MTESNAAGRDEMHDVDSGAVAGPSVAGGSPRLLYTAEEAAELLSVPATWLKRKAGTGVVPSTRVGRFVRFSRADLEDIATGRRQPAELAWDGPSRRARRRRPAAGA